MAVRKKAVQRLTLQTVEAPGGRKFLLPGAFFLFTKSTPASIVIDTSRKTAGKAYIAADSVDRKAFTGEWREKRKQKQ